jgi:ribonucleoside-diphosphate reductase alpha chain
VTQDAEGKPVVDWELLRRSVEESTHFLDNVVTANAYVPSVPEVAEAALRARRIGLGIMGLGDMMYGLGIRYGSAEGQEFAAQVMEFVRYHAMRTSIELARQLGAFKAFAGSIYDDNQPGGMKWAPPVAAQPFERDWQRPDLDWGEIISGLRQHGIRNAAQTTVAPTGTIATVCGVEGYGCEPVFALGYIRHFKDGDRNVELAYTSPLFEAALAKTQLSDERKQQIRHHVATYGACQDLVDLPESMLHTFVVSSDISAEEHVRMQAAIQAFVDNSISKTCNFPEGATEEDVAKAYMLAWETGCKGLTVYVTGSRQEVVLETKATKSRKDGGSGEAAAGANGHVSEAELNGNGYANGYSSESRSEARPMMVKRPRPGRLHGATYRKQTPLGTAYITVNSDDQGEPFEIFLNVGKAGSEVSAVSEALGRVISLVLRMPASLAPRERLQWVMDEMAGIGGARPLGFGVNRVRSLPDGIAQVLAEHLADLPAADEEPSAEQLALPIGQRNFGDICPECGEATFLNVEGCRKCHSCGYSEC